ncbi:hypothetical protein [Cellulomonas endophytica]|uniref:hypothetical protein n=1 Tax=Cellulomonas endophytica TaxID=2494735 RepID=UPI00101365FC|nr:hypothetical protein [Cellulomonas endophytica]
MAHTGAPAPAPAPAPRPLPPGDATATDPAGTAVVPAAVPGAVAGAVVAPPRRRGGTGGGVLRPERARTAPRATWFTLLGLVLVPLVVGGLLTWALWQPTQRLDRVQAAVVNLDEPVELDGQTVPLGRQLASALVTADGVDEGSSEDGPSGAASSDRVPDVSGSGSSENFRWVLTDAQDAAEGLEDGTYATVVTIPPTFSAAATSTAQGPEGATRATIDIATSARSRLVDAAVSQAVTGTAVQLLGQELTTGYLSNVFVGFDTLSDSLGQAADGAAGLASGAGQVGSGADTLASGARALADGVAQLDTGAGDLADGVGQLASGADDLADGTGDLADGAAGLASGLDQLATQTRSSADAAAAAAPGAAAFTQGLDALAGGVGTLGTSATDVSRGLAAALQACGEAATCTVPRETLSALAQGAGGVAGALTTGGGGQPSLQASVGQLQTGGRTLADGVTASATGLSTLADYLRSSADGAAQLSTGAAAVDRGARALADGAGDAAAGADALADGAGDAAAGATTLADGAAQLSGGAGELTAGATGLADGLTQAQEGVPTYTEEESAALADVIADPVATTGDAGALFGSTSVPFLGTVALWLGALATFLVLGAVPRRALGSTRSSVVLALRAYAPAALVGVVQGLAVTAVMAGALDLSPGGWATFAVLAALSGATFAAVVQGLVAVLGGVGRFVAVVVAVLGMATAVISTVPAVLDRVVDALPLAAGLEGLQAVVTGTGGAGGAAAALVVWLLGGLAATTAAVARRRVVPAGRLAAWTRAA